MLDSSSFRRSLFAWFRASGRDLPWRRTRDPYSILVSEVMLQQTQVATVLPYYKRWLRRFPDFRSLALASESDVLRAWQGLGYYARARNLHATAKAVVASDGSLFPSAVEDSRRLPGVGRYTANAVATFAFDQSVPIVEANTARLLARLSNLHLNIDRSPGREKLWTFAASLLPKRNAAVYNGALIDLGAMICVAGQPRCCACPVRGFCKAKDPVKLPKKKSRPETIALTEHHAIRFCHGRILLEQSQDRWRGMWILPRLLNPPETERPVYTAEFPFTYHRITLAVYRQRNRPVLTTAQRWVPFKSVNALPLPSPHRRAVAHLLRHRPQNLCSALTAT